MRERRISRINYGYIDRLFQALDQLGIDPTELPREFIGLSWENKLEVIRTRYNVSVCYRCKLPKPEEQMDIRYAMCNGCASTLHSKRTHDPRITRVITQPASAPESASIAERIRNLPTGPTAHSSSVDDILNAAAKRRQ